MYANAVLALLKHQQYPGKAAVSPQANIHIPASCLMECIHYTIKNVV